MSVDLCPGSMSEKMTVYFKVEQVRRASPECIQGNLSASLIHLSNLLYCIDLYSLRDKEQFVENFKKKSVYDDFGAL